MRSQLSYTISLLSKSSLHKTQFLPLILPVSHPQLNPLLPPHPVVGPVYNHHPLHPQADGILTTEGVLMYT